MNEKMKPLLVFKTIMNNMAQRAITGTFFVIGMIAAFWYSVYTSFLITFLIVLIGSYEFISFYKEDLERQPHLIKTIFTSLSITSLLAAVQLGLIQAPFAFLVFPILFIYLVSELWTSQGLAMERMALGILSMIYLIIPAYFILDLSIVSSKESPFLIGMFLLIWTNDTFAYLTGRMLGKTKLFERISPKKTWEGTMGGFFFTVLVGFLIGQFYDVHSGVLFWVGAAVIVAPTAIVGDLLESLFKRSRNIKDSGSILPGHGGILDRFDAALFTAPFFYGWWLLYTLSLSIN